MPLRMLSDRARQFLTESADRLFGRLPDVFFELADDLEDGRRQTQYFDAISALRNERTEIVNDWVSSVTASLQAFADTVEHSGGPGALGATSASVCRSENPCRGEGDSTELIVAFDKLVSEARIACDPVLTSLSLRLGSLLAVDLDKRDCPLSPEQITDDFLQAIGGRGLAMSPLLTLLKLYDEDVLARWGGFLEQCDELLCGIGILPDLDVSSARKCSSGAASGSADDCKKTTGASPRRGPLAEPSIDEPDELPIPAGSLIAEEARCLDQLEQGWNDPAVSRGVGFEPEETGGDMETNRSTDARLTTEELLNLLDSAELESMLVATPDVLQPIDRIAVLTRVQEALARHGRSLADLDRQDRNILALLDRGFREYFAFGYIPQALWELVSLAVMPVVKTALANPAFFESEQHPARRLLNEVASASIGLSAGSGLDEDPVYKKLVRIFEQWQTLDDNARGLSGLLLDFICFVESRRQEVSVREREVVEKELGNIKLNDSYCLVERALGERLLDKETGFAVLQFVEAGWSKVLFAAALKYGADSRQWMQNIHLLDQLLGLESAEGAIDGEFLTTLLALMEEALIAVNFDAYQGHGMLENVRCYFLEGRDANKTAHPIILDRAEAMQSGDTSMRVCVSALVLDIPGSGGTSGDRLDNALEHSMLAKIDSLKRGVWVEMPVGDGAECPVRARLLDIVEPSGDYIFGDHCGGKIAVQNRQWLACKLKDDDLKILDKNKLFDGALAVAIHDLYGHGDGSGELN